ncbi:type II secretion system protein GspL [Rheinheimera sp.]|uniref:type II secretion system protein GspL n=1 Tax=Rheinheimera sp. TaxID=1869214 RepID=UPI0027B9D421|nr:type II secretion system protein GspL [Rheinheimera sp.]
MNEQLIIRLGSVANAPVDWLVWSALNEEIIASGRLAGADDLPALAQRLGQRPVVALVPACDVVLKTVPLPGKPNRQLLQALPFMLEEDQAEDIEQLLLLQGQTLQQDGQYSQQVAVVRRAMMEQWLAWLQQAGFSVQRMVPDALLLPDAELPLVIELSGQWLLKQGPWQVSCIDESWWPDYLALLALPLVLSYSPWPEAVLQQHQLAPAELPLALLARQLNKTSFSLLQGDYAPKKPQNKHWQQWRLSISLAAAVLLLYLSSVGLESWLYQRQATQARSAATELYKSKYPNERIVNLKRQVERKLAANGGVDPNQSLVGLLSQLQPLLAQQQGLNLDNLRYDSKKAELRFQATADGFQSFEQLKTQLQQQGFTVEQGALSNIAGKVQGTITMRSKT